MYEENLVNDSILAIFCVLLISCNFLLMCQVMQQPAKKRYPFGLSSSIHRAIFVVCFFLGNISGTSETE